MKRNSPPPPPEKDEPQGNNDEERQENKGVYVLMSTEAYWLVGHWNVHCSAWLFMSEG